MRFFLDSSVFIAACLSRRGASHEIIQQGLRGTVMLVISDIVLEETERNLASLPRRAAEALALFEYFIASVPFVVVTATAAEVQHAAAYTKLKDAPIVAAAKHADVEYLVSLDRKDLVNVPEVSQRSGLTIVLPEDALAAIRRQRT